MKSMIELEFPNGARKELSAGVTSMEIAAAVGSNLAKKAIAGRLNGRLIDLRTPIHESGTIEIVVADDEDGLYIIRHSAAHLMAQALKRLYPDVKLGIGPVIEAGFYYDIDTSATISVEELARIEAEMKKIAAENYDIHRRIVTGKEAVHVFEQIGDNLKLELIRDIPAGEQVALYEQGEFVDLCRGPHVPSTGKLSSFKLLSVAGAYWRGDSNNKMLQRIYGTAFSNKSELDAYLAFLEEARKRDHRKLGKQLELFMFSEEAPGMPFYLPKGQVIRNELERLSRELQLQYGYEEVRTPLMMNQRLWEESGHWEHYHENMYFTEIDDRSFALKPMNCPGHMLIYQNQLRSYRDLPIRMAEFGQVHRHEFSGALNGMLRVRTFCQDDAHIFATPDQIEEEIKQVIRLIGQMYSVFGFSYTIELSTRPEKSMGSDVLWERAEGALRQVLQELAIDYKLNPGDGAFYGPKIDFHIKDALNRSHQCATIQLDFQMPMKFNLHYVDEDNRKVHPIVIHRAVYGSIDRFFGILIEHYAGAFPVWLAPVQAMVIPVSDKHADYARRVVAALRQAGIRGELDNRSEKMGYKIRSAQLQKIPYTLVAGNAELEHEAVSVRKYGETGSNSVLLDPLINGIKEEIQARI
ncbi:threonine--tRNA ligase [Paenibacillus piri]|uniref:Threonine--tRNA ligase n=1 Tax=Paenibacillus piri TaxID=2547395 RepID=A0A4R5KEH7_9BACL|nr:threonine--tRNA ligase [Paenibacillus piri]TDF93731.1 threonine--tRNA ligase [Paenibacillus piri]